MRNVSLKNAIRWAYHLMDFQVTGPGWLANERYDIMAKAVGQPPSQRSASCCKTCSPIVSNSPSTAPLSQLVDPLSSMLRAPVVDLTGLKGRYDVTLDIAKYIPERGSTEAIDPVTILTRGLHDELGLKLKPRKLPIEFLIVDHAEKIPVEN